MLNTWLVVVVHNHMLFDGVARFYSRFLHSWSFSHRAVSFTRSQCTVDSFGCSHGRCARHRADILIYLMAILYLVPPLFCCLLVYLALVIGEGEKNVFFFCHIIFVYRMVHSHDCRLFDRNILFWLPTKDNETEKKACSLTKIHIVFWPVFRPHIYNFIFVYLCHPWVGRKFRTPLTVPEKSI